LTMDTIILLQWIAIQSCQIGIDTFGLVNNIFANYIIVIISICPSEAIGTAIFQQPQTARKHSLMKIDEIKPQSQNIQSFKTKFQLAMFYVGFAHATCQMSMATSLGDSFIDSKSIVKMETHKD
jgi:hypothetical protein